MGGSSSKSSEKTAKHAQELGEKKGSLVAYLANFKSILDRFNARAAEYPIAKIRKKTPSETVFIQQAFEEDLKELTKIKEQVQRVLTETSALESSAILSYSPPHTAQEAYLKDHGFRYVDFLAHIAELVPQAERTELYQKCVADTRFRLSVGMNAAKSILDKRLGEVSALCQTLKESLALARDASAMVSTTGPSDFGSPVSKATPEKDPKQRRPKVEMKSPDSHSESSWGSVSEVSEEQKESRAEKVVRAPAGQLPGLFAVKDSRADDDFEVDVDADSRVESQTDVRI